MKLKIRLVVFLHLWKRKELTNLQVCSLTQAKNLSVPSEGLESSSR